MSESPPTQTQWTVGKLLDWTMAYFETHQVEGGRLAAELLLARAMDCPKIALYTRYDEEPASEQRDRFRGFVRQAAQHTPIAYLLGEREFYSLTFKVTSAVLVPRPETETLAQRAIEHCRSQPDRTWSVLDVGTGSGCVAIAIARYAKNANVIAGDISSDALAVAGENVAVHIADERVRLIEADGLDLPEELVPEGGFDLIVSNPPYIDASLYATLPPNVRDHEPKLALTGRDGDGLAMYHHFAEKGGELLADDGRIMFEIGMGMRESVTALFEGTGGWVFVAAHRDPTDPHDRVLEFTRQT
jgi:release factor glutamine methyltransferase